ncbi:MAG: hypothetical protein AAF702_48350 [Chloroflexota bacterium]
MDNNTPEDEFPEDEFHFGKFPPGTFPTPEELAAQDLADRKRRIELADYFAATFDKSDPREIPRAEQNHIMQFDELDRRLANPRQTLVRDYLGNPWVKPLAEISPEKLEEELDLLLEFMYLYGIAVDFLADVSYEEAYRFITEELLDVETTNMAGTGMTTHFIYEEFYPNDEYDVKMWGGEFLYTLLRRGMDEASIWVAKDELRDPKGNSVSRKALLRMFDRFRSRYSAVTNIEVEPIDCNVDGDHAVVKMATTYTGIKAMPTSMIKTIGHSTLWLKRDDVDSWSVTRARIAGWDALEGL